MFGFTRHCPAYYDATIKFNGSTGILWRTQDGFMYNPATAKTIPKTNPDLQ